MGLITIPWTFSAGAVIVASQHNSNFSTISSAFNGNIENVNIKSSAAIAYSKLNLTGNILNADVNASAAIANSKLNLATVAQDTTLNGKVLIGAAHQGDVFYDNGTQITRLTPGTAGQALITGGASANPAWGAGGGTTLVSNTAISVASSTGNIAITNTNYYLVNCRFTALSADDTYVIRINNDTNNNYSYITRGFDFDATPTATNGVATATSSISTTFSTKSNSAVAFILNFRIYPQAPSDSAIYIKGEVMSNNASGGSNYYTEIAGFWDAATTATSFRILTTGSHSFSGNVYLYKYSLA